MEVNERLADVEAKLARLEERLARVERDGARSVPGWFGLGGAVAPERSGSVPPKEEDELELVVGQKWFAHAGILVLAIGAAFALSLPYPHLPAAVPSLVGYGVVAVLFLVARAWTRSFELLSHHLRAAGMALLYFATLRLFYFGAQPAMSLDSPLGRILLLVAAGVNLAIALYRRSNYLVIVALPMACITALLLALPALCFGVLIASCLLVSWCRTRLAWQAPLIWFIPLVYLTHLAWALNNPLRGGEIGFIKEPALGVFMVLVYGVILGTAPLLRKDRAQEGSLEAAGALLNAAGCYGVFLLHSLTALESGVAAGHLLASLLFLGMAILFWVVQHGQATCFIYAMTGYTALSMAILQAFEVPDVFVWLSLQSLVVVTTALWFRSPFIIVANFFIYLAIVLAYVAITRQETGISLGFGLVALVSARIMAWQRERLQLKTELMRNAYLVSAFLVFPYSLYHLFSSAYVAVAWVGLAGIYYLLNTVLGNPKYRWMGHFTLLLTVLYVLVIGIIQLGPTQRIFSFLLLGTALVVVSLVVTRQRAVRRPRATDAAVADADNPKP